MAQILLSLLFFVSFLIINLKAQSLLKSGTYCNIHQDCEFSCCLEKRCAPTYNDCLALEYFAKFEEQNYCTFNVECPTRCCLHGECMSSYTPCFDRYDRPLLMGLAVGVACALVLIFLAFLFTPSKPKPAIIPPPPP